MNRRGFTLIELTVAGVMATIVLGGITTALSQLGSAKSVSRQRLEAFSRCDTALRTLRKDIITTLRRGDLFETRLLISDGTNRFQGVTMDQDELLVFDGTLRANKEIDFNGEGIEYETQFRIEPSDISNALWKRRDAILDDNPVGGGMVIPIADGIIGLQIEAFDGDTWLPQWDSDILGIPEALRITVSSTGMLRPDERHAPKVTLRTIVPLDRFRSPDDKLLLIAQQQEEERLLALGVDPEDASTIAAGLTASNTRDDESADSDDPTLTASADGSSSSGSSNTSSGPDPGYFIFVDPDGNEHQIPLP